jgi:hypothetical protein
MIRTSLLVGALLAATAVQAAAQGPIRPGQTVRGELTASDPKLNDDTHYDMWRFRGEEGHVYAVTLRSDAFDAYLAVGSSAGNGCDDCESDDDGAGGTDSRVEFRAPANGAYEIRANSLMEATGAYTVELEDLGEGAQPAHAHDDGASVEAMPIQAGPAVEGELTEDDVKANDDSFYDLYVYRGRAGETLTITMASDDFDTYLSVGVLQDGEYAQMESNDDGPDGTDSELTVTFPEDGEYLIRANALVPDATGDYTLQITRS